MDAICNPVFQLFLVDQVCKCKKNSIWSYFEKFALSWINQAKLFHRNWVEPQCLLLPKVKCRIQRKKISTQFIFHRHPVQYMKLNKVLVLKHLHEILITQISNKHTLQKVLCVENCLQKDLKRYPGVGRQFFQQRSLKDTLLWHT